MKLGRNEYKRATIQGPVGKLELQGGSQMLHCSRHLTVSLGTALLALLVLAPAAFAQSAPSYTTDVQVSGQVTTNECSSSGEPVSLNGNLHAAMSFATDSNGANHFSISIANDLTGAGQNSGLSYTAKDSNDYSISTSDAAGDITVEFRSDLNPAGGGVGMTLVQKLHMKTDTSGNISVEVMKNSTQCGS